MSSFNDATFAEALANCSREPVHIPGQIQSVGILLGFDLSSMQLSYVSENAEPITGGNPRQSLGKTLDKVLPNRQLVHAIRGALSLPSIHLQRERIGTFLLATTHYDAAVSTSDSVAIIELEVVAGSALKDSTPIAAVRRLLAELNTNTTLEAMLGSAVRSLRNLTGFDRVMAYRFLDRGDGEVVAEARSPGIEPFLGLRYPASDIPDIVRTLMVKTPFRMIADAEDPQVKILGQAGLPPLDLSLTQLRGVSPIHIEYLRNMGVSATMNASLIVRGELWGLFAFHHYQPYTLTPDQRSVCELAGHLISLQLQQKLEQELLTQKKRADSFQKSLRARSGDDLTKIVSQTADDFCSLIHCDGLALLDEDRIERFGTTPSESGIRQLSERVSDELYTASSLVGIVDAEERGNIAGATVMDIDSRRTKRLMFFREEIIQQVRWAGNHEKQIEIHNNEPRLKPRSSFAEYCESVRDRSAPWTDSDISVAVQLRSTLIDLTAVTNDESLNDLKKSKQHQDLLIAELNHRVKNILALVRSIARQTKDSARSLENYAETFERRILALSNAHDLAGGSGIQWVRLRDLLQIELKAFAQTAVSIDLDGPSMAIRGDVAPLLALMFHELASNATKYGALSPIGDRLSITWTKLAGGLQLQWKETVREPLGPPKRRGFGLSLIQRAIPHECGGECELEINPEGLNVLMWLPQETIQVVSPSTSSPASPHERSHPMPRMSEANLSAIVVEDNMVLAMEMESLLTRFGFSTISTFGKPTPCRTALQAGKLTGTQIAVLDINLGDESCLDLAQELAEASIPLIFVSGYDKSFAIPDSFSEVPRLQKPVDEFLLYQAIDSVKANRP